MAQSSRRDGADGNEPSSDRASSTDELWSDVRIDPVEIALPAGVGLTLRAYRRSDDLPAVPGEPDEEVQLDEFDAAQAAVAASRAVRRADGDGDDDRGRTRAVADEIDEPPDLDDELAELEEFEGAEEEEEEEEPESAEAEEVPVFLARRGRLYLFRTPDKLLEFVRSGVEHDLASLDTWSDLVDRVSAADIEPLAEDHYELDLIVANLRGGPDVWDPELIVKAGELARDLGYALRIEPVLTALAPGSPLDDLDEALRAVGGGGVGGFLAKRRLRRIPAQQSALAWRTIIGKISAAVDWRD